MSGSAVRSPLCSRLCGFVSLVAIPLLAACGGEKGEEGGAAGGSDTAADGASDGGDGGGDGSSSGCPDEVPEQYRNVWDCDVNTCDGTLFYHIGSGTSTADGQITLTEQWFMFTGPGEWCTDTFEMTGTLSDYDPATFNCSECEEVWQIRYELTTGNSCSLIWGSLFYGDDGKELEEGPERGFMLFETHNAFGSRNEDNGMLVISAPILGDYYYPDINYGRGTATPSTDTDGPPQDYEWVSGAVCATSGG
jgi:hypothetical protein